MLVCKREKKERNRIGEREIGWVRKSNRIGERERKGERERGTGRVRER